MHTRSVTTASTVISSIFFTLQLVSLACSCFLYFTSDTSSTQREVITRLYHKDLWRHLRRSNSLSTHSLIAVGVQAGLVPLTVCLLVGITKKRRFLMLPWLTVWGLGLVAGIVGAVLCVIKIPGMYKLTAVFLVVMTVFLVLPTWFTSLHVFSDLTDKSDMFRYDIDSRAEEFCGGERKQDLLFRYLYA
eukprot:GFUD01118430.1.p1 GENE.GFUD01118430.1~~GFUD01118430.1.p1  ORF type:complete len:207 (-),score=68.49 GFUD01118430.1:121-687(-)